jgi:hypothetical protein
MALPDEDKDKDQIDLALKRFDCIFRYLAYENNVYWVRGQFFLLGNTALLGFELNNIPTKGPTTPTWNQILASGIAALTGVVLTLLWQAALTAGDHWIHHWMEILRNDLEPDAFGQIHVMREWSFRQPPSGPRRSRSAKRLAHLLALLFGVVWIIAILYVAFLAWAKFVGWTPAFSN